MIGLAWNVARVVIISIIIVVVGEISRRYPRTGALLLSLPIVSILAFLVAWLQHHDLKAISQLSRETLILVPLGLPFFLPLAFAQRIGLDFWTSLIAGVVLASLTIGGWLVFAPASP